jgi:hypothetical protein
VCYLEEKPELDEGPFLKEAKSLINTVAEKPEERKEMHPGAQGMGGGMGGMM